jgi:N6-adenosine-specific RNA methylase IME4
MEFHKIANIFPIMQPDEYENLVADIKQNGLIEPIVLFEGKILDGRNRWKACLDAGIEPRFENYNGNSPISYVVSKNAKRRHLSKSQLAMIATEILPMLEEEAEKRRITNLKQNNTERELMPTRDIGRPRDIAGAMLGVTGRYIEDAKKIKIEAPEFVEPVLSGEISITDAVRQIKKAQVIADLENVEAQEAKKIDGVYDVIVIDPPWPMKKIERDVAPNQVEFDYPTMSEEELFDLEIPCADNCHVWLWTTHKYLPIAFKLLESWGLKYVCTFVWHKPGGFQPFELPQYNCEFALYARRGTPKFIDLKNFPVCFSAPRGEHSEKPQEFYDLINRVTAGRRLDMFNRREIPGFDTWGKEAK